jgi:alcohol dehydrogenase class IV
MQEVGIMILAQIAQFAVRTRIISGANSARETTGREVASAGGKKVLVVTDKGIVDAGLVQAITESLESERIEYEIYDGVKPNPTVQIADEGYKRLQSSGCDTVVAIGGGSSIDAAKAVGVLATNGGMALDYEGRDRFTKEPATVIAIPTTCGTGSEVTPGAVLSDEERRIKTVIAGALVRPKLAILDPTLLTTLPAEVTAATGLDALTHAMEAYVSRAGTPLTEALSLSAVELVGDNLRIAVANNDLEALMNMLIASTMAGMAFGNARLGIVHALTDILGGMYDVPHGLACAILLPHATLFNLMGAPDKYATLAVALGRFTDGLTLMEAAEEAVDAVEDLIRDVGLTSRLQDIGVKEAEFTGVAEQAMKSPHVPVNPKRPTAGDLIRILGEAY